MAISRRNFLQVGAIALLSAGTPLSLTAMAAGRRASVDESTKGARNLTGGAASHAPFMSKATFAPYLNTTFSLLAGPSMEIPVELVEIHDMVPESHKKLAAKKGQECFALVFRARRGESIKQDTHQLSHAALGQFGLFIGPLKSLKGRGRGQLYEAVINHLKA